MPDKDIELVKREITQEEKQNNLQINTVMVQDGAR